MTMLSVKLIYLFAAFALTAVNIAISSTNNIICDFIRKTLTPFIIIAVN